MGKDKFENEELIRWAWPEDVWFHVDEVSSAHVYLRLPKGQTLDDIPPGVLEDCCQLVKANSIQGHKMPSVNVIYCWAANLKKTADLDIGTVMFHDQKAVRIVKGIRRNNEILNRLNKTKVEKHPDLQSEREARDEEERAAKKAEIREKKKAEQEAILKKKKEQELRSYASLMKEENMRSNKNAANFEEEFM